MWQSELMQNTTQARPMLHVLFFSDSNRRLQQSQKWLSLWLLTMFIIFTVRHHTVKNQKYQLVCFLTAVRKYRWDAITRMSTNCFFDETAIGSISLTKHSRTKLINVCYIWQSVANLNACMDQKFRSKLPNCKFLTFFYAAWYAEIYAPCLNKRPTVGLL